MYDVYKIREDFPIFAKKMNNNPVVYLDSAASSQEPYSVINKIHIIPF